MTSAHRPRRATFADLEDTPENMNAEIIAGELVLSPRPAPRHTRMASKLGILIGGRFDGPPGPGDEGGWWIFHEPELHLGDEALIPDIGGWRRERMPTMPSKAYFELAPDWVCEVLSPSTFRRDRMLKMASYARASVAWAWLVDPIAQTVEAYRLEGDRWVDLGVWGATHPEIHAARIPPFESWPLDLALGWD